MERDKEQFEHLSDLVDGRPLSLEQNNKLQRLIAESPGAASVLSVERSVKRVVGNYGQRTQLETPANVQDLILASIRQEVLKSAQTQRAKKSSFQAVKDWFGATWVRPAFAFGIVALVAAVTVVQISSINGVSTQTVSVAVNQAECDLICTAYGNFEKIRSGSLPVSFAEDDKAKLDGMFRNKGVQYKVAYPKIDAGLHGGIVTQGEQTNLAHLVYKVGSKTVYICEVPNAMIENGQFHLNQRAKELMKEGKWYWEEQDGNTLLLWVVDGNMCAIVADMKTEELASLIVEEEFTLNMARKKNILL